MTNYKRIIFEVIVIASIFTAVHVGYSKSETEFATADFKSEVGAVSWADFSPQIPKAVDSRTAVELLERWEKVGPEFKGRIPLLGYNPKTMKLAPFDMPARIQNRYDPRFLGYVSQAWFRDSIVSSTNDLEERIRKIENTINRIMALCCPAAENK